MSVIFLLFMVAVVVSSEFYSIHRFAATPADVFYVQGQFGGPRSGCDQVSVGSGCHARAGRSFARSVCFVLSLSIVPEASFQVQPTHCRFFCFTSINK